MTIYSGFSWIFPLKLVISHSYGNVYLRVQEDWKNCNVGLSGRTSGKNSGHVEPTRMGFLSQSGETHQHVCGCGEKQIRGSR